MTDTDQPAFGCETCWPPTADAAWQARRTLRPAGELIGESHFHVFILECPRCSQRFLSVFTETIDWDDGEDPQYWTVLPLTAAESTALLDRREPLEESEIQALGPGRRSLRRSHPKGETPSVSWGKGIFVGPHD